MAVNEDSNEDDISRREPGGQDLSRPRPQSSSETAAGSDAKRRGAQGLEVRRRESSDLDASGTVDDARDALEAIVDPAEKLSRQQKQELVAVLRTLTVHQSGPLPLASEFRGYEEAVPGAGDRILTMAEVSTQSQIKINEESAHAEVSATAFVAKAMALLPYVAFIFGILGLAIHVPFAAWSGLIVGVIGYMPHVLHQVRLLFVRRTDDVAQEAGSDRSQSDDTGDGSSIQTDE